MINEYNKQILPGVYTPTGSNDSILPAEPIIPGSPFIPPKIVSTSSPDIVTTESTNSFVPNESIYTGSSILEKNPITKELHSLNKDEIYGMQIPYSLSYIQCVKPFPKPMTNMDNIKSYEEENQEYEEKINFKYKRLDKERNPLLPEIYNKNNNINTNIFPYDNSIFYKKF